MQTYVLRVYRRSRRQLAGFIEVAGEGLPMPFRGTRELLRVLHGEAAGYKPADGQRQRGASPRR